jgi:hypothetical protein
MISASGYEAVIYLLWGIVSTCSFFFVIRFFLYDGQMVGVHKATWFLAITYCLGIASSTATAIARAIAFLYVPSTTATTLQTNLWICQFSFALINAAAMLLWPIVARRTSIDVPKADGTGTRKAHILVHDWRCTIFVVLAALCALTEWIMWLVLSYGSHRVYPNGTPFLIDIAYVVSQLGMSGGFLYYTTYEPKTTKSY